MLVNTGTLRTGANDSQRAGWHADDGANHLSGTSSVAGMSGDFAAAEAFHKAVTQAHTHHAAKLRVHQQTLSGVGDEARTVATAFTEMDERNASKLKAVRCNSAI